MFDGEMVKRNFPFEKKFGQKFWSKTKLDKVRKILLKILF